MLTSRSQSAHVLYMSPFTLCLHLTCSSGSYRKPGEIDALLVSNVCLQARVRPV